MTPNVRYKHHNDKTLVSKKEKMSKNSSELDHHDFQMYFFFISCTVTTKIGNVAKHCHFSTFSSAFYMLKVSESADATEKWATPQSSA